LFLKYVKFLFLKSLFVYPHAPAKNVAE